jgi:hypothetical protein
MVKAVRSRLDFAARIRRSYSSIVITALPGFPRSGSGGSDGDRPGGRLCGLLRPGGKPREGVARRVLPQKPKCPSPASRHHGHGLRLRWTSEWERARTIRSRTFYSVMGCRLRGRASPARRRQGPSCWGPLSPRRSFRTGCHTPVSARSTVQLARTAGRLVSAESSGNNPTSRPSSQLRSIVTEASSCLVSPSFQYGLPCNSREVMQLYTAACARQAPRDDFLKHVVFLPRARRKDATFYVTCTHRKTCRVTCRLPRHMLARVVSDYASNRVFRTAHDA